LGKKKKIQFLQQIDAVIENQSIFHTWSRRRKCRRSSCEVVNGYNSYLILQLGSRTLPPCFPPQQIGRPPMALWKHISQSDTVRSGVHCTRLYSFWELLNASSSVVNFLAVKEFDARVASEFIVLAKCLC
jgi:hypothetical protein